MDTAQETIVTNDVPILDTVPEPEKPLSVWQLYKVSNTQDYAKPHDIEVNDIIFSVDLGAFISADYLAVSNNAVEFGSSFLDGKSQAIKFLVQNCLKGWKNFPDEDEKPLEFSRKTAEKVLGEMPMLATLLVQACWIKAWDLKARRESDIKN